MVYTYKTPSELAAIIETIKEGEYPQFAIYDANTGRRLKYDFESGKATLLLHDDGIMQDNPFYKSIEDDKDVLIEDPSAKIMKTEEELTPDPESITGSDSIKDAEGSNVDEFKTEVNDYNELLTRYKELETSYKIVKDDNDSLNNKLNSVMNSMEELNSIINGLKDNINRTEFLVNQLVLKGYTVSVSTNKEIIK